jgi:hypothetical protein
MKNALEGNRWLLWLGLQRQTVDARERARDVLGAMLGLWVAGALTVVGVGRDLAVAGRDDGRVGGAAVRGPEQPLWPSPGR